MTTTTTTTSSLVEAARAARTIQLSHILQAGQTRNGPAVPFAHAMTNRFEDQAFQVPGQDPEISGVSDMIAMGCHTGTHMDSLVHVSYKGCLVDGTSVSDEGVQDYFHGVSLQFKENVRPLVARGVLLDFTTFLDVERVPGEYEVGARELADCAAAQGVEILPGDVVLFRMGYDLIYREPDPFLHMPTPGPNPEAARELVRIGVVAVGSDTMAFEAAPGAQPMLVHALLIPQAGIHIFEMLDLRELSEQPEHEFLFLALPLRIRGATASPVNPVALVGAGA